MEALRASFPMARWRETLADGDDLFTEANIAEAGAILDDLIDRVRAATRKRSAPAVLAATKRVVTRLNALNRHHGLIETLERDELGTLVDAAVRATGLPLREDEDVTAPWREW